MAYWAGFLVFGVYAIYKMFDTKVIQSISLKEKRFGFEPEVTAKIARIPNVRI